MKIESLQEVILGVNIHLDVHVGVIISEIGQLLGTRSVSASTAGYLDLLNWALSFGVLTRADIEGTGTYESGICRFLLDKGVTVLEVNRPDRAKRRQQGKSDPIGAESAARAALSGIATVTPKHQSGACEAMRIISVARRRAVKSKTQTINQLWALLVSAP